MARRRPSSRLLCKGRSALVLRLLIGWGPLLGEVRSEGRGPSASLEMRGTDNPPPALSPHDGPGYTPGTPSTRTQRGNEHGHPATPPFAGRPLSRRPVGSTMILSRSRGEAMSSLVAGLRECGLALRAVT
jgi:hypothetical protein